MATTAVDVYLSSHGLKLQQTFDITKGRSIISTTHHKRGSILITSQALGSVVLPSCRQKVCNYCFQKPQPTQTLQRCSQCKSAYFCDMACFKNAWLGFHQYVCKPSDHQRTFSEDQDALDLEMLERVALNCWRYNKRKTNQQQQGNTNGTATDEELVEVTMEAFDSLMGHEQEQPQHVLQRYNRLAEQAISRPYFSGSGLTVDQLVRYLCRFQCNNFGVHDDGLFTVGEGTYPVASLFNHSCRPNAVIMYDGTLLEVVAIEPIEPYQEVTIAYVDAAHDRPHRQGNLSRKYLFNCDCVRCSTTDDNVYGQIDTLLGNESDTPTLLRDKILRQVNDWDLLEMSRFYDRRHGGKPDPAQPLTMATYTHYAIQYFAPYLWYTCNSDICIGKRRHTSSTSSSSSATHLPSPPSHALSYFDDPLPQVARPKVPMAYEGILSKVLNLVQSYPIHSEVVPYRLTTLVASTRLLNDEMELGHWRNAVKLGMYILIQYCLIYPPYHPILAQHLLLLAKCSWNSIIKSELLGDGKALEDAYERGVRRWIMLSKETLTPVLGGKGEQWRELVELEWIFLREQKLKE